MLKKVILRKDHIIFTTIEVMNEQGVQAVSTREIAKREGVSEGAIFKHFPKKSDLILAVLDYFSQYDQEIFQSSTLRNQSPREAIRYIVEIYATYYHNYPEITVIGQSFDEISKNPDLKDCIDKIRKNRINHLITLIDEAKKEKEISENFDSETLADIIMGSFNEICLKWRLDQYNFSLKDRCIHAINMILSVFV